MALKPHIVTFNLFVTVGLFVTLTEHSGYEILNTAEFHNLHHKNFKDNYSTFGIVLDQLYGSRAYPSSRGGNAGEGKSGRKSR